MFSVYFRTKELAFQVQFILKSYEIDSNHYLFSPPWKKYGSKGVAEIITTSFSKESVEPQEVRYYDAKSDGGGEKCDGGSSGNR